MDRYGMIIETIGRITLRLAFSVISFVIAFVVATVVIMVVRITLGSIAGQQISVEAIHPIYAPFWLAVGMWAMQGDMRGKS